MVSQSSDESDWREAQTEVMRLVESGNFLAAISYLEAGKDAVTVSANYIRFAQSLYKERKDVSRMLMPRAAALPTASMQLLETNLR
jgi:hypothetical protein